MTLLMLTNLGLAGSGADAPAPAAQAAIPSQSYAAIYRRSAIVLFFAELVRRYGG